MPLPAWIGEVFRPIADIVDELHVSKEEYEQIRVAVLAAQAELAQKVLDYEMQIASAKRDIIVAEAQGESWMQRNWRPLLMLTFTVVIAWQFIIYPILSAFIPRLPQLQLPSEMWTLLTVGVGGYILARSGEKIVTTIKNGN